MKDEKEAQENLFLKLLMKVNLLLWSRSIRLYSLSGLEEWTLSLSHRNSVQLILNEVDSIIKAKKSLENIRKGLYNLYTIAEAALSLLSHRPSAGWGKLWGLRLEFLCSVCHKVSAGLASPWLWFVCVHRANESLSKSYSRKGYKISSWLGRWSFHGRVEHWGWYSSFASLWQAKAQAWLAEMEWEAQHLGQREKTEHWLC